MSVGNKTKRLDVLFSKRRRKRAKTEVKKRHYPKNKSTNLSRGGRIFKRTFEAFPSQQTRTCNKRFSIESSNERILRFKNKRLETVAGLPNPKTEPITAPEAESTANLVMQTNGPEEGMLRLRLGFLELSLGSWDSRK